MMDVESGEHHVPVDVDIDKVDPSAAAAAGSNADEQTYATASTSAASSYIESGLEDYGVDVENNEATCNIIANGASGTAKVPLAAPSAPEAAERGRAPTSPTATAPPPKKYRAPSPPRWRFVKEAKSTLGYTSHAAGTFVRGKSSQELGAKYVAPALTYTQKMKQFETPGELNAPDLKYSQFTKQQSDVGMLSPDLNYSQFTKQQSDVGRLSIAEGGDEEEDTYGGGVVMSHDPKEELTPGGSSRSWANYQPRPKDEKEVDEYEKDKFTTLIETENYPQLKFKGVGQLSFNPDDYIDQPLEGDFPRITLDNDDTPDNDTDGHELGHYNNEDEQEQEKDWDAMDTDQLRKNARALLDRATSVTSAPNVEDEEDNGGSADDANTDDVNDNDDDELSKVMNEIEITSTEDEPRQRRKLWFLLLLLPLILVAGTIVAIVLGGDEKESTLDAAEGTRGFPIAIMGMSINDTSIQPSSVPSVEPSSSSGSGGLFQVLTEFPEGTTTLERPGLDADTTSIFDRPDNLFDVPGDESFMPTYSPTESAKVSLFITSPEPTAPPPSTTPSSEPSSQPSTLPTAPPSNHPVTLSPTQQPIVFIGGCPGPYQSVSYYNIGTQVTSDGIVYECVDYLCSALGYDPGLASGKWSEVWEIVGSCSGTLSPTQLPTRTPSVRPSQSPSAMPSQSPSKNPNRSPTTSPSAKPSQPPTSPPSREPSQSPTNSPSKTPTRSPTSSPVTTPTTFMPTVSPTRQPSITPSRAPSKHPTQLPSNAPSKAPSQQLTTGPSKTPSESPTPRPSQSPTSSPSDRPVTSSPTKRPTIFVGGCPSPYSQFTNYTVGSQIQFLVMGMVYECLSDPCNTYGPEATSSDVLKNWELVGACSGTISPTTASPTEMPTREPSVEPTRAPSETPSMVPTDKPTASPSDLPTKAPSYSPTKQPTTIPSRRPSVLPTRMPSDSPSNVPTITPSKNPSELPTRTPSNSPSESPTRFPSKSPSKEPTVSPSKNPSTTPTLAPSKDPSAEPTETPTINPTQEPTLDPTLEPTQSPTKKPTASPTLQPTNQPTSTPTPQPSDQPTAKPTQKPTTLSPTLKPTCKENGNFNLCFAIDMSGSVCNGDFTSLCLQCQPSNQCNSGGEKPTICCPNFANMLEFTKDLVTSLGELPTDQDFSIVHFATDVFVASTLDSSRQAAKTINQLRYTGGMTNLGGAIDSCQTTLANSPPDRTNLMLVLTDGAPTVPEFYAAGVATTAAIIAKNAGTFIIPVLIEEELNQLAPEKTFLENNISSDGQVFVANFAGLSSLEDVLFEQVTCQA